MKFLKRPQKLVMLMQSGTKEADFMKEYFLLFLKRDKGSSQQPTVHSQNEVFDSIIDSERNFGQGLILFTFAF